MSIYAVWTRTGSLSEGHFPMPAVATPTAPPPALDNPAGGALGLIFTTLPALLRLTCGLFGAAVAVSVRPRRCEQAVLLPAVAVLTGWSLWYAHRALRHGIGPGLVAGDVAVTALTCLLIPVLVAPEVLPGEGSWIAVLASTTVINAQATASARWSIPAGLLVIATYVTGAQAAGNPVEARRPRGDATGADGLRGDDDGGHAPTHRPGGRAPSSNTSG